MTLEVSSHRQGHKYPSANEVRINRTDWLRVAHSIAQFVRWYTMQSEQRIQIDGENAVLRNNTTGYALCRRNEHA